MLLCHGVFRAVQAVENEPAEEREANLAVTRDVLFSLPVDKQKMVGAAARHACIDVFSQLNGSVCSENEGASVSPCGQTVRSEPVDAEIVSRAVVADQNGLAEVLKLRIFGMVPVGSKAVFHLCIVYPGIIQVLFDLMASDVAQNTAVFLPFKEPARTGGGAQTVRPHADYLQHASNRSLADQVAGVDGTFGMQALRIVDHVFFVLSA